MLDFIKKHTRTAVIIVLFSMIALPNSVYASSSAPLSNHTTSYATSFFSSLVGVITSLFEKEEKNTYTYPSSNTGYNNVFAWLKGKDSLGNWGDCENRDSYSLWDKYYGY